LLTIPAEHTDRLVGFNFDSVRGGSISAHGQFLSQCGYIIAEY
jgi:hypothetical protein